MASHARTPSVLQFAQNAFIVREGRLVLVRKNAADPEQPNAWDVPGGRLKLNEGLDDHIKREVLEEVGLEVTPAAPFAMWDWLMAGRGEHAGATVRVVAIGRPCTSSQTKLSDENRTVDDFLGEARWVAVEEVSDFALIPSLVPPMQRFLSTLAQGG